MSSDDRNGPGIGVDPAYALRQLERALATLRAHGERTVRDRAAAKARRWRKVLDGIIDGTLVVGSRRPVKDVPTWATLEVVHGGFATGSLLAGGPLRDHEIALARQLEVAPSRYALNVHYLGDEGRAELNRRLRSGCYRIDVPEEGALLVVAWLIQRGEADRAEALLDTLAPFFDRLRFHPVPTASPPVQSSSVRLQTVAETVQQLDRVTTPVDVLKMNEALGVWAPLYDEAVKLFLETVKGEVPTLRTDASGRLVRREDGCPIIQGGWPCQLYPADWGARAGALLEEYREQRARNQLCGKPDRPKENFARLRGYLERCVRDPSALSGRDVGMVRKILASFVTRHGVPGSAGLTASRAKQTSVAARPTYRALADVVIARLQGRDGSGGIDAIDPVLAPVTVEEQRSFQIATGSAVPRHLAHKVARCLEATADELVRRGVIGSAETLARVLPQMTSRIRAAGIADPDLRRLYAAVYTSFRRRRSLLLLNLESQVRLEELPWVSAIDAFRTDSPDAKEIGRRTLREVAALAVGSFPQTIVPNKLLRELRALIRSSGLDLPVVDELAADIFMGEFSGKYVEAAKIAARLLSGTLYARYYGVPCDLVQRIDDLSKRYRHSAASSAEFAALCGSLARLDGKGRWSVARNGAIIEQQQVLTTHNLAVLFDALDLEAALSPRLASLADACFRWVCRKQAMKVAEWKPQLRALKNCAYAWRQMVFFLSLVEQAELQAFLRSAEAHLSGQNERARARLGPALAGLRHVASGGELDADGRGPRGARRFLGWSTGRHWMLGSRSETDR